MSRYLVLMILTMSHLFAGSAEAACDEKVVIDSVVYQVPAAWCGHTIDSSLMAKASQLVRLPQNLCYRSNQIFLTRETRDAFTAMAAAADSVGIKLEVKSGFRSGRGQQVLFRRRMAEGRSFERIALGIAPPGYSEHETGRALDLRMTEYPFHVTKTYRWLVANAGRFGFHETFPEHSPDKHPWEPWHWAWGESHTAE